MLGSVRWCERYIVLHKRGNYLRRNRLCYVPDLIFVNGVWFNPCG